MSRPLEGIRIVEVGTQTPGKQCSGLLCDLGAEVIRVERPGTPPTLSPEDLALNRGKRSVVLDLRRPEGLQALLRICARVDVFLEGYRPGTAARLGFAYGDVREVNPRIVYCSLSSFGQNGPLAGLPAFDIVTQARAGILTLQAGPGGSPAPPRLYLADITGALMAAVGILVGLAGRERRGDGVHVDASMLDGLLWWFTGLLGPEALADRDPPASALVDHPGYTTYEAGDGRWLALGVFRASSWRTLCELLGHPEFAGEQWAGPPVLKGIREKFAATIRTKPAAEWLVLFAARDIEAGPCDTLAEALRSEHARARRMLLKVIHPVAGAGEQIGVPLKFSNVPPVEPGPAPLPGQDTGEILAGMGYTEAQIEAASGRRPG